MNKEITLHFEDEKSNKVYIVEMSELADNLFTVNFAYGRATAAELKEGTKTPIPVIEEEANEIFDNLVESKMKKGYREVL